MEKIHIKHVGPLSDTGEIELNRVMLLIGPQGAGKSTFMKILCFCRWVEKRIMRNNEELDYYAKGNNFIDLLKLFFHLSNDFFRADSLIVYRGLYVTIAWGEQEGQSIHITLNPESERHLHNSKLSFIPAERNLASAVENIHQAYHGRPGEDMLFNHLFELREASRSYTSENKLKLSVGEDFSYYSGEFGQHFIEQHSTQKSYLSYYTASGLQSVFPIDVICSHLINQLGALPSFGFDDVARIIKANGYSDTDVNVRTFARIIEDKKDLFKYSSIHLFIEEPELSLYPESQKELLLNLLGIITKAKDKEKYPSSLVMTTHSPYLLSVMNVQIAKAWAEEEKKRNAEGEAEAPSYNLRSWEFSAYYISKEGTLKDLIARGNDEGGKPIEFPMVDGTLLDSVSDDVNDELNDIYTSYYHG